MTRITTKIYIEAISLFPIYNLFKSADFSFFNISVFCHVFNLKFKWLFNAVLLMTMSNFQTKIKTHEVATLL